MNFCSHCGSKVALIVPPDDNRQRFVCADCGTIHYQNPNNICGAILSQGSKVLLCKRAIEPRYGYWTLPAGFMENNETLVEGAARETFEEANAKATGLKLFGVFSMPYISQVYVMFKGQLDGGFSPGIESLEVDLFEQSDIPWDDLAFPVIRHSLHLFYDQSFDKNHVHHAWFGRDQDRNVTLHGYE